MESFSRTLENYTGSYLARRRRKRIAAILAVVAILALLCAVGFRLSKSGALARASEGQAVSKQKINSEWNAKKWDDVRKDCVTSLASRPLDSYYLCFAGLASYYRGMEYPDGEDRATLVDESVVHLRKALAAGGHLPKAQVEYVLGKAYYEKGDAYFDESVKFMEASIADGYLASDSREYLALAYVGTGDKQKAIKNFEAALAKSRSELLLIAAAKAYSDADEGVKAEALLLEALANGKDEVTKESGRFLLGDIYRARGQLDKAEEQYSAALKEDQASAEAHYRLGLIYQARGDSIKARAEWRKAVSIDPMHAASRQKLAEKL
jgi:Uncharacterized protein conserved in bacteria